MEGGRHRPLGGCRVRQRVALLVPFRNRSQHLPRFLAYIHRFLARQPIAYGLYIIEQAGDEQRFNRGMLLNVGFREAERDAVSDADDDWRWECYVSHDVDMLPESAGNRYACAMEADRRASVGCRYIVARSILKKALHKVY